MRCTCMSTRDSSWCFCGKSLCSRRSWRHRNVYLWLCHHRLRSWSSRRFLLDWALSACFLWTTAVIVRDGAHHTQCYCHLNTLMLLELLQHFSLIMAGGITWLPSISASEQGFYLNSSDILTSWQTSCEYPTYWSTRIV